MRVLLRSYTYPDKVQCITFTRCPVPCQVHDLALKAGFNPVRASGFGRAAVGLLQLQLRRLLRSAPHSWQLQPASWGQWPTCERRGPSPAN